jgi:hypothetical protein
LAADAQNGDGEEVFAVDGNALGGQEEGQSEYMDGDEDMTPFCGDLDGLAIKGSGILSRNPLQQQLYGTSSRDRDMFSASTYEINASSSVNDWGGISGLESTGGEEWRGHSASVKSTGTCGRSTPAAGALVGMPPIAGGVCISLNTAPRRTSYATLASPLRGLGEATIDGGEEELMRSIVGDDLF